jgi:hypothetical protein
MVSEVRHLNDRSAPLRSPIVTRDPASLALWHEELPVDPSNGIHFAYLRHVHHLKRRGTRLLGRGLIIDVH